jgi:myo-inositol-1-phosphate synthase
MAGKINVAIVGVGSFAKALVEGVSFYTKNPDEESGLLNPTVGGYRVKDIDFVCAFDVDSRKVGRKLSEAISTGPNVAKGITEPLKYQAMVYRGPTLDGVIDEMRGSFVEESKEAGTDVVKILKQTKTDVVVNLLPTGSDKATHFYADAALEAGCNFINCIPTPLATIPSLRRKFESKGLVIIGDDIKSQIGATMLNRLLLELLQMRGVKVTKSFQENVGGNADHFNLQYRSASKEKSKSEALSGFLEKSKTKPDVKFVYTGKPSGHKQVNLKIEGEIFGRIPISITSTIEDEISFNGAGTLVDAIRIVKLLSSKGRQKEAVDACPFLMKSPPKPIPDSEAFQAFKALSEG